MTSKIVTFPSLVAMIVFLFICTVSVGFAQTTATSSTNGTVTTPAVTAPDSGVMDQTQTTVGLPNTGIGGEAYGNIMTVLGMTLVAMAGSIYLVKQYSR